MILSQFGLAGSMVGKGQTFQKGLTFFNFQV